MTYEQLEQTAKWLAENPHKKSDYHFKKRAAFASACQKYLDFAAKCGNPNIRDNIETRIYKITEMSD